MQATLTYTLPDDEPQLHIAIAATDCLGMLTDLRDTMRNKRKYTDLTPEARAVWDEIWTLFYENLCDYHLEWVLDR